MKRLFEDIIDKSEINSDDDERSSEVVSSGRAKYPLVKDEQLDPNRFNVRIDFLLTAKKNGRFNLDKVDELCEAIDDYIWKLKFTDISFVAITGDKNLCVLSEYLSYDPETGKDYNQNDYIKLCIQFIFPERYKEQTTDQETLNDVFRIMKILANINSLIDIHRVRGGINLYHLFTSDNGEWIYQARFDAVSIIHRLIYPKMKPDGTFERISNLKDTIYQISVRLAFMWRTYHIIETDEIVGKVFELRKKALKKKFNERKGIKQ